MEASRDATRRARFFLHRDGNMPKDFLFALRFIAVNPGAVWLHCVGLLKTLVGEEATYLRMRMHPPTSSFDCRHVTLLENHRKTCLQA
jgi:hypothetical protein